ncbi:MAG TPA: S8 family serine peptidase [Thermoanaerobaculia bacterium]|nr:S8 family serine peptidase [Thermoanaerobaculia bacterium]
MTDPAAALLTDPLTRPVFESFTVWIASGSGLESLEERARRALRESLRGEDAGWEVKAVHESQPGMFDLIPPEPGTLTVEQAWNLTYTLLEQPFVVDAEPSFEILQDNADALAFEAEEEEDEEVEPMLAGTEPPIFSKALFDWCPRLIDAPGAWALPPHDPRPDDPPNRSKGGGIVIGHPDAGYQRHPEILDEMAGLPTRMQDGWDFVDNDNTVKDKSGGHGLGTASALMSAEGGPGAKFVTGVAPAARIISYRVTKPHLLLPAPVLLESGMSRLGDALFRAVDDGCHVISISLGWLPLEKVRRAVQHAYDSDVIVVAAAGNQVRFVVWPAHYDEVVSCAGCTSKRRPWSGSSRGKRVDITGPAEDVWKASVGGGGAFEVEPSSGTSFAATSVAGTAALWLAHWGRKFLLDRYQGEFRLTAVFRRLMAESCDPPPTDDGKFGKGIVNARRLLETPLPTLEELRAEPAFLSAEAALTVAEPTPIAGVRAVAEAFDDVPRERLNADLSLLMNVPEDELLARLQGVGRELVFHTLTNPEVRKALLATENEEEIQFLGTATEQAAALPEARASLLEMPLSERLRRRIAL